MGMFDDLRCRYPLPVPGFEGRTFQTKSLDCVLALYEIGADGQLYQVVGEYEPVPEEQRPYYGKPEWNDPKLAWFYRGHGSAKRTGEHLEPVDYHGDIYFCAFERAGDASSELVDFQARFDEGKVRWIKRIEEGEA